MKINDKEILFEFKEEEGSVEKLRLPNNNYFYVSRLFNPLLLIH